MKQLLLRIDDGVHARLRERARREHRSINAIAGDILAVAATIDPAVPCERVRARAAALGVLSSRAQRKAGKEISNVATRSEVDMNQIARMTAGWGVQFDEILAEDRGRS